MDHCCDFPPNYLFYVERDPGKNTLSVCEGHCNHDDECVGDLICGNKNADVPGCDGTVRMGVNYCHYGLGECRRDCQTDSDCQVNCVLIYLMGLSHISFECLS